MLSVLLYFCSYSQVLGLLPWIMFLKWHHIKLNLLLICWNSNYFMLKLVKKNCKALYNWNYFLLFSTMSQDAFYKEKITTDYMPLYLHLVLKYYYFHLIDVIECQYTYKLGELSWREVCRIPMRDHQNLQSEGDGTNKHRWWLLFHPLAN